MKLLFEKVIQSTGTRCLFRTNFWSALESQYLSHILSFFGFVFSAPNIVRMSGKVCPKTFMVNFCLKNF